MRRTLLALVLAIVAAGWLPASAYETWGVRYDHTCITYSEGLGDAVRAWAAVSAIEDCGVSETPDIALGVLDPWPYPPWIGRSLRYDDGTTISRAVVEVPASRATDTLVLTHEVGHALGMKHSDNPDALMFLWCCAPMSPDDVAGIQSIYGTDAQRDALRGPYRVVVGGLMFD